MICLLQSAFGQFGKLTIPGVGKSEKAEPNTPTEAKLFTDATKSQQIESLDIIAEDYLAYFPINKESIKGAMNVPGWSKSPYAVAALFERNGNECLTDQEFFSQDGEQEPTFSKIAKDKGYLDETINGSEFRKKMIKELNRCDWPNDVQAIIKLVTLNKSREFMIVSAIALDIPGGKSSNLYQSYMGDLKGEGDKIYERFTRGNAANTVNDEGLASVVENHMEQRGFANDVTTVNLTGFTYEDYDRTTFKMDGFYIQKSAGGECLYNSFYGNGSVTGSGYSISFFNSMTRERVLDCEVAEKLRNR